MGTVAIQTQCCLNADEEPEDEDGSTAQEGTAVQVVDALHWGKRPANAAGRPGTLPATVLPRSCSEASTIFVSP